MTLSACSGSSSTPKASGTTAAAVTTAGGAAATSGTAPAATVKPSAAATTAAATPAQTFAPEDPNHSGTPKTGGTLHLLGDGDVDYMDPNISSYTEGLHLERLYSRDLVTFPAIVGKTTTVVPDIATAMPTVSADGLTYTATIRTGVKWNTTPARQVTAADFIRGVKRTCNPAQPFGDESDFTTLIAGLQTFCDGFAKVVGTSATAIAAYQNTTQVSGLTVDPSNPLTVHIKLIHPASYFLSVLGEAALAPAPKEYDAFIPASAALAQKTISDGPYMITKYNPAHEIDLARNPAWVASTDPVRKAYVDNVVINETGDQTSIQQQLEANTSSADLEWDAFPTVAQIPALIAKKDPNFYLGPSYSSNPYVIYNTVSPNNTGALSKIAVRQALSEGIDRDHLIQDDDGPSVSPPLTHVLPAGISGTTSNTSISLYPYNPTKAKADLAAAGYPSGLKLTFLYRPKSSLSTKIFTTLQQDFTAMGVTVTGLGVPNADFYTKYLEKPDVAKKGTWDLSLAGWGPDWYGDAALSFFGPLFDGKAAYPPNGSNFGFYENPKADALIAQAGDALDSSKAAALWVQADQQVMADAAFFPITADNQPTYHASHVHNDVYLPAIQGIDPANVWLSGS